MDDAMLKSELTRDEGRKPRIYPDTKGKWTGGIGHNFSDKPLSDRVIDMIYEDDVADAKADLDRALPWWRTLSDKRQRVLVNMCFNMGIGNSSEGLLSFEKALTAMQSGDGKTAAAEMLDSEWAVEVGDRSHRLAKMMEEG